MGAPAALPPAGVAVGAGRPREQPSHGGPSPDSAGVNNGHGCSCRLGARSFMGSGVGVGGSMWLAGGA